MSEVMNEDVGEDKPIETKELVHDKDGSEVVGQCDSETQEQSVDCQETAKENKTEHHIVVLENINVEEHSSGSGNPENDIQHVNIEIQEDETSPPIGIPVQHGKVSVAQVLVNKPLCADYRSASESSDTESKSDSTSTSDSESDSDSSTFDSESDSSSSSDDSQVMNTEVKETEQKKTKKKDKNLDLSLGDLPPIENLKISVPEEECQEIGVITSVVDTLVVVQAYKDTPALDIDTVLFLDKGMKTLGKVFDVLGPVSEPVYTVRFNKPEEITENNITKDLKVYCAPKTEYTSFVFVSELMKMRGSDASWKNNEEAPPDCQDFSDDEEEQKFRKAERSSGGVDAPSSSTEVPVTRKRAKVHHGKFPAKSGNFRNPFASGPPRPPRFAQPGPRYHPASARAPHFPGLQPPRFPGNNPFCNPVQPPYFNATYQYSPQMFNVSNGPALGGAPNRYQPHQGMNYYPNYPQPCPYPPYMFPATNRFFVPGQGPMPSRPPGNLAQRPQAPTRVFGTNIENPSQHG